MSSEKNNCKLIRLGINDNYTKGGNQKYLQDLNGLSIEKLVTIVEKNIN